MADDDIQRKGPQGRPLRVEQGPHQWAHVLEELEPGAKTLGAHQCGFPFRRIDQRQELAGKRRKSDAAPADHSFELDGSRDLHLMAALHQPQGQCDIGLDVASGSQRLDRHTHIAPQCETLRFLQESEASSALSMKSARSETLTLGRTESS